MTEARDKMCEERLCRVYYKKKKKKKKEGEKKMGNRGRQSRG